MLNSLPSTETQSLPWAPRKSAREHSEEEWAAVRPIIVDLYQRRTLRDVIDIMSEQHNFKATYGYLLELLSFPPN
jgi:hypothetical protein